MSHLIYNWKRYWHLRDGGRFHVDNNGFLVRSAFYKDTFEFASIAETPCLVLLGEPGIGKSQTIKDAIHFVSESFPGDKCFPLDLRSFGDEGRLYDALFNNEKIKEWLNASHSLHLFLDSFDECLLRIETVASLIADELKTGKYPVDRLWLRLTSRTAEFPRSLEESLRDIWKKETDKDSVKVYELCPLQASDVAEAAQINNIPHEDFFREVYCKNAGTLAARPITLRFLLTLYQRDRRLPDKLTDLYEQGCRILCDEQNESRRSSSTVTRTLTADQRLVVAGRIAAMMVFCNKVAVWKEAESGENENTDVLIRELSGYSEISSNLDFSVNENAVRETLFRTGLFTARGPHRLGWTHQTFEEFLAAWYVSRHRLGVDQLLSLITQPAGSQKQVTPQLKELVAWLASLRSDVFDELLTTDPVLLLRSDVASLSPDLRERLVDELLKRFREEKESDLGLDYKRLKHPRLANQLLPVVRDKSESYLARRFAIDVAEACELHELQNDLCDVILDETEPDYVRANAGYALWKVGDAATRKRIKNLGLNGTQNDNDQRVRGIALVCNWNENMTAEEGFSSLVRSSQLRDAYALFLNRFTSKLQPNDLPIALRWVKEHVSEFEDDYAIANVIDEIMLMGWQNLETAGILNIFAEASLARLRDYEHDVIDFSTISHAEKYSEQITDAEKRRAVLKAMVSLVDEEKHESFCIIESKLLQLRKEDLNWLFDQLDMAQNEEEQKVWLQWLGVFYSGGKVDPESFSALYRAYLNNPSVRKYYSWVFDPVELDSVAAKAQRERHEHLMAPRKKKEERLEKNALNPPPKELVLERLNKFEKGDMESWWHLNMELGLSPQSPYIDEWQFDLKLLPGWKEADPQTRERIIDAAKLYVEHGDPENDQWLVTGELFRPAFAGYRALYLLLAERPDFIETLSDNIWRKWAAIIVSYPLNSSGGDEMIPHEVLINKAYRHAAQEVIQTVLKQIDADNEKGDLIYFPQRMDGCWNTKFKDALRNKLDDKLSTQSWGKILEELLEHGDVPSQQIAENAVISFSEGKGDKERALRAAASLIRHAEGDRWWSLVWEAIQKDTDFGHSLVETVASERHPASKLKETDIVEFYLWLVRVFPPSEDPKRPIGHAFAVTTRMEIAEWRSSFVSNLKNRGTLASLEGLEKIAASSPELSQQLHWMLIEARENVRRHNWQPLTPEALLKLLKRDVTPQDFGVKASTSRLSSDEEIGALTWTGKPVSETPALLELLKDYTSRHTDFVFMVGAGLSRPLFPSWASVLEELIRYTSKRLAYATERVQELSRMLSTGAHLDVADACARDLGENNYRTFIERHFDKEFTDQDIPQAYASLLTLEPKTLLTTNYDRIPDVGGKGKYRVYSNSNIGEAQSSINNSRPTVFKLHGCVTQQNSIVFTRAEYQTIYNNASFRQFLGALFILKPVIFLGFGLADPYLTHVLDSIYAGSNRISQGKYALLEGISQTEVQSKERSLGLNVIPYQKSDNSHPEVLAFIELLRRCK